MNSIEFYSSSSSTYFSKSEFKFEFDKNKLFRVRVQADEYPKSRQLFHRRCSWIKIFCSCSRFKAIPQLFSTIEIASVAVTIEQQTIFRSNLLFLLNNFNVLLMNSNSNSFFRVQVQVRVWQNDPVLSSLSSQPWFISKNTSVLLEEFLKSFYA